MPAAQGVTVSTLHSAKGLEWDAVALFGVHEGSLPFVLATTPEQVGRGAPAALRRGHPGPASCCGSPGPAPATAAATVRKPSRFLDSVLPESVRGGRPRRRGRPRRARGSVLSAHCRSCGQPLADAAERKIGRHADCPATYDDATMELLREWRRQEAAEQKLPAYCVFTDATLVAMAEARPRRGGGVDQGPGPGSGQGRASTASRCWRSWPDRAEPAAHRHAEDLGRKIVEIWRKSVCTAYGYSLSLIDGLPSIRRHVRDQPVRAPRGGDRHGAHITIDQIDARADLHARLRCARPSSTTGPICRAVTPVCVADRRSQPRRPSRAWLRPRVTRSSVRARSGLSRAKADDRRYRRLRRHRHQVFDPSGTTFL